MEVPRVAQHSPMQFGAVPIQRKRFVPLPATPLALRERESKGVGLAWRLSSGLAQLDTQALCKYITRVCAFTDHLANPEGLAENASAKA